MVDITTEAVIARPRAVVADYAADPTNAPEWYSNIGSVDWISRPPLAVGSRVAFVARFLGRELRYTYEIVEFEPRVRLLMRTAEGPFPMATTYIWADEGRGSTRMTLRNHGEPSGFGRAAATVMGPAMRRANRKDLARLRSVLEAG